MIGFTTPPESDCREMVDRLSYYCIILANLEPFAAYVSRKMVFQAYLARH